MFLEQHPSAELWEELVLWWTEWNREFPFISVQHYCCWKNCRKWSLTVAGQSEEELVGLTQDEGELPLSCICKQQTRSGSRSGTFEPTKMLYNITDGVTREIGVFLSSNGRGDPEDCRQHGGQLQEDVVIDVGRDEELQGLDLGASPASHLHHEALQTLEDQLCSPEAPGHRHLLRHHVSQQ